MLYFDKIFFHHGVRTASIFEGETANLKRPRPNDDCKYFATSGPCNCMITGMPSKRQKIDSVLFLIKDGMPPPTCK